jgi:imidazolonepropionase
VLRGAAVLVADGVVAASATRRSCSAGVRAAVRVDCAGGHHARLRRLAHARRVRRLARGEYALRSRGVPYMEIARRGGGINASVRDVRARSEDELVALTAARLEAMLRLGTTTVEIKSGYGLDTETELKQLRAVRRAVRTLPVDVVPTFLGAHEFPAEYRDRDATATWTCSSRR